MDVLKGIHYVFSISLCCLGHFATQAMLRIIIDPFIFCTLEPHPSASRHKQTKVVKPKEHLPEPSHGRGAA